MLRDYVLISFLSLLAGMVIARRHDVFSMFRSDTPIKDKKVLMFMAVAMVYGTFCYSYIKHAKPEGGLLDVGWGWVVLLFIVLLGFLGPDALIKMGNSFSNALAGKVAQKIGDPPPSA